MFPWWLNGKNSLANAKDGDSIPGSERSPGEGNGNPLQYSCLENPMDRVAWWATVHVVTELETTQQLGSSKGVQRAGLSSGGSREEFNFQTHPVVGRILVLCSHRTEVSISLCLKFCFVFAKPHGKWYLSFPPGIRSVYPAWKCGDLTAGQPGNSLPLGFQRWSPSFSQGRLCLQTSSCV